MRASNNGKDVSVGLQSATMVKDRTMAGSSHNENVTTDKDGNTENHEENITRLESFKFHGQSPNYSTPTALD